MPPLLELLVGLPSVDPALPPGPSRGGSSGFPEVTLAQAELLLVFMRPPHPVVRAPRGQRLPVPGRKTLGARILQGPGRPKFPSRPRLATQSHGDRRAARMTGQPRRECPSTPLWRPGDRLPDARGAPPGRTPAWGHHRRRGSPALRLISGQSGLVVDSLPPAQPGVPASADLGWKQGPKAQRYLKPLLCAAPRVSPYGVQPPRVSPYCAQPPCHPLLCAAPLSSPPVRSPPGQPLRCAAPPPGQPHRSERPRLAARGASLL